MPESGGLKGGTAPGDAHPYLVLFCIEIKLYNEITNELGNMDVLIPHGGNEFNETVNGNAEVGIFLSKVALEAYARSWGVEKSRCYNTYARQEALREKKLPEVVKVMPSIEEDIELTVLEQPEKPGTHKLYFAYGSQTTWPTEFEEGSVGISVGQLKVGPNEDDVREAVQICNPDSPDKRVWMTDEKSVELAKSIFSAVGDDQRQEAGD